MMRFLTVAAALAIASTGIAHAADDTNATKASVTVKEGEILRDSNQVRIGQVSRVYGDGSVQVIYGSRFVVIPAGTLSEDGGKLKTTLTRQEIGKLK